MNQIPFKVRGMQKDLAESSFNPQFAYDIKNMRIMATNDNTLMSLVNEKGPKQLPITWHDSTATPPDSQKTNYFLGNPIGHASIGDYYVLFTTDSTLTYSDRIYKFWFEKDINNADVLHGKTLAIANLGFDKEYPIETLVYYENEDIQKVYWVDGINQPRFINIVVDNSAVANNNPKKYDFSVELLFDETITITKTVTSNGLFPSGVIQYAFTYFNKYGQESNIFHTTPLHYLALSDRGGSPEENVNNTFHISIVNPNTNFDYVRIYSIYRTSINGIPIVKQLADIECNSPSPITYTDRGVDGNIIDPRILLYIGGEQIIANTLNQKDNTLFLGNITLKREIIEDSIATYIKNNSVIEYRNDAKLISYQPSNDSVYSYRNSLYLPSNRITTFKQNEWYRFGVIFQHTSGKWSDVVWVGDAQNNKKITFSGTTNDRLITAQATINHRASLDALINKGFVRAKGVVVYPTIADRTVICQGILNPTMYNAKDRYTNSPFVQASWFTRPMVEDEWFANNNNPSLIPNGSWAEYRHDTQIPSSSNRNGEIQNIKNEVAPYIAEASSNWISANGHRYYIDQSIVTMHSPDIEFDDQLKYVDFSGTILDIVGIVPITSTQKDIDIQTSTAGTSGVYHAYTDSPTNIKGGMGLISGSIWQDTWYKPTTQGTNKYGFVIYPWHRKGSLNNASNPTENETLPSILNKKKMSNLRFSAYTDYGGSWTPYNGIKKPVIFDSNEMSLIKLEAPLSTGTGQISYYGNIDKLSTTNSNYPIVYTTADNPLGLFNTSYLISGSTLVNDPISIKYKSSPHAVIAFNDDPSGKQQILPMWGTKNKLPVVPSVVKPFWKNDYSQSINVTYLNYFLPGYQPPTPLSTGELLFVEDPQGLYISTGPNQEGDLEWVPAQLPSVGYVYLYETSNEIVKITVTNISGSGTFTVERTSTNAYTSSGVFQFSESSPTNSYAGLYIAELKRLNVTNRFGGNSKSALNNNQWLSAGPEINIPTTGSLTVTYTEGDTFFQRYDHLKTYPFTMEDSNSVTDIVSFMVETRVNIDGRYDKNRGNKNNLTTTPNNFNLLNPVYNQTNNFFIYRPLSSTTSNVSKFANTITWSLTKSSAALTDAWTNITMASVLDLDGDKGGVNVIKRFNNELIAFQDKGVSNILFNSRTQLTSTEGVPIEIANSGKVDGKRYISDKVGCQNKWSIVESPSGLYFIDDIGKSILLFNGQLQDISDEYGFHSWINDRSKEVGVWNPSTFNHVVGYYDKVNGEVLFISKDECLAFSEPLKAFTSFYSYNNVPYFMTIKDKGIWVNKSRSLGGGTSPYYMLWEHNEGEYNRFFDKSEDFHVTVIANPEPSRDKIFDILEFRSDSFDETGTYQPFDTFDKLETWNEYQSGLQLLSNNKNRPSPLKKKFRMWRVNIPRDRNDGRSRMRNPWLFLKLSKQGSLCHHKTILHDLIVHYTI